MIHGVPVEAIKTVHHVQGTPELSEVAGLRIYGDGRKGQNAHRGGIPWLYATSSGLDERGFRELIVAMEQLVKMQTRHVCVNCFHVQGQRMAERSINMIKAEDTRHVVADKQGVVPTYGEGHSDSDKRNL